MNLIESLMDNYEDKSLALGDGVLPYIDGHTRILDAPLRRLPEKSCTIENSCMLFAGNNGTYDQISAKGFSAENQNIISNSNGEFVRSHNHESGGVTSACLFNPKSSFVEETGPKHISFLVDSDATLMDLNLGRSSDSGNSKKSKSIDDNGTSSSSTSPVVAKRTRTTNLNSQTAFCQVFGCNMDLSSFKEYYRRHRVCQTHSKAANVTVNGKEQRFCQQCSRFHLLNEFDDGKRSCRKRLAGHNARRRKPQISVISGRMGRVTRPYPGLNFLEATSLDNRSFSSPSIFSYSAGRDARFENNMLRHPTPAFGRQLPQTFQIPSSVDKKQFTFINSMDARTMRTNHQYNSDYDPSFATSSFTISSSGISESGCAHTLLSSQDQNMKRVGRSYFENTTAMASQALNTLNLSDYNLSSIKHMQNAHLGVLTSDARNAADFQSSRFIGANEHVCHENSQTVDLLPFPSALLNGGGAQTYGPPK